VDDIASPPSMCMLLHWREGATPRPRILGVHPRVFHHAAQGEQCVSSKAIELSEGLCEAAAHTSTDSIRRYSRTNKVALASAATLASRLQPLTRWTEAHDCLGQARIAACSGLASESRALAALSCRRCLFTLRAAASSIVRCANTAASPRSINAVVLGSGTGVGIVPLMPKATNPGVLKSRWNDCGSTPSGKLPMAIPRSVRVPEYERKLGSVPDVKEAGSPTKSMKPASVRSPSTVR